MLAKLRFYVVPNFILIVAFILVACGAPATPETVIETIVVTELIEGTPVEVIQLVTPTPEPTGPRTLVVCKGGEPDTLFMYGTGLFGTFQILDAIYDGPFDTLSYDYQPVILEKLPSLADGDAILTSVIASEGDSVVDADGEVMVLDAAADPPVRVVPAGETTNNAVIYQGGDIEMDQMVVTFKLLPGLVWSDGTPLTATDSEYAFNLQTDPELMGNGFLTLRTASYEAIDDLTTVWTGIPGFKDATYMTNYFGPAPEHVWGQFTPAELLEAEESSRTPVGWGPYVIDEWVDGATLTMHKNPNYFRANEGLPVFDTLIFRFLGGNGNANIAALLAGECDMLDQTAGLGDQSELLLELNESGEIISNFVPGTVWEHVDFGIQPLAYDDGYQMGIDRPDFFSDLRTRWAFVMCMDRQSAVDTVMFGQSIVIDTYLPPNHPLYNPEVRHYEFNPELASTLLDEVGWMDHDGDPFTPRIAQGVNNVPDGTSLEVTYETTADSLRQQVTSILQQSLAECGIQANLVHDASGGVWDRMFEREFDLGQFAWVMDVEPPCHLYLSSLVPAPGENQSWISIMDGAERPVTGDWVGPNLTGFVNEQYDLACLNALNSLPGQEEYETGHKEAQLIFSEQLPITPLFLRTILSATRPDFCNLIMDPSNTSEFWNIEEFDYGEGCVE